MLIAEYWVTRYLRSNLEPSQKLNLLISNRINCVITDGTLTLSCVLASEVNVTTNCIEEKDDKGNYQETCYCDQSDACNGLTTLTINQGRDNSATKNNKAISMVPLVGMVTLVPMAVITYAMPWNAWFKAAMNLWVENTSYFTCIKNI